MQGIMKFDNQVAVGGQPTSAEIRELAQEGYRAVINLRTAGEDNQPLSPEEEGREVERAGMVYRHIPVSPKNLSDEQVDHFRDEITKMAAPVFVHCHSGKRSGAFVVMQTAIEKNMPGQQAIEKAMEMGFECDVPELEEFVKNYIDQHRK